MLAIIFVHVITHTHAGFYQIRPFIILLNTERFDQKLITLRSFNTKVLKTS